jgi:hypothetical protein
MDVGRFGGALRPNVRPPRLDPALDIGLKRYFLTLCTAQRQEHFTEVAHTRRVYEQILQCSARFEIAVIAYCFTPDHLHLLAEGAAGAGRSRQIARGVSTTRFGPVHDRGGVGGDAMAALKGRRTRYTRRPASNAAYAGRYATVHLTKCIA